MPKYQILALSVVSSFMTLIMLAFSLTMFSWLASAAPAAQNGGNGAIYMSQSGLVFMPVTINTTYTKDITRQLLSLVGQTRPTGNNKLFVAPLNLPHKSLLAGMSVFGQDSDNQGEIRVRLKRCDNNQARCLVLAEASSTNVYALGLFETSRLTNINEVVDNALYTYFLEAELTALFDSGLRSVRLDVIPTDKVTVTPTLPPAQTWSLAEATLSFIIPNTTYTQVRVCTNDLSYLNNSTHYPTLIADGELIPLGSKTCVVAWGTKLEIRRNLNTGPSAGTYEFLR